MGNARRQFRENVESEIVSRAKEQNYDMTKAEIEDIGVNAGLPRERVEQEFLKLAGHVWAGYIYPEDGLAFWIGHPPRQRLRPWLSVVFDPSWLQRKGKIPRFV